MERNIDSSAFKKLIDKCQSSEAKKEIEKIEVQYEKERIELDTIQTTQDGNFMLGKMTFGYGEKENSAYVTSKKHMDTLLFDSHISEAEKVFEEHHPDYKEEEPEIFDKEVKNEKEFAKGYNEGFLLFKDNAKLCEKVNVATQEKEDDHSKGMHSGSEQHAIENREQEHDKLKSRAKENSKDITKIKDTDKEKD